MGSGGQPRARSGTDLWVNPRDARRVDLGLMLGLQVKNGESWFSEPGEEAANRGGGIVMTEPTSTTGRIT